MLKPRKVHGAEGRLAAIVVALFVLGAGFPLWAGGNVHLIVGSRCDASLGEFPLGLDCLTGDAEPGERMDFRGGTVQVGSKEWPVRIEFAILWARGVDAVHGHSGGSTYDYRFENRTGEVGIGFVKTWSPSRRWRLYAGGGLSALHASSGMVGNDYTDLRAYGLGFYADGGGYMILAGSLHVGIDMRTLLTSRLWYYHPDDRYGYSDTFDLDGTQIGLLVGYGWPSER